MRWVLAARPNNCAAWKCLVEKSQAEALPFNHQQGAVTSWESPGLKTWRWAPRRGLFCWLLRNSLHLPYLAKVLVFDGRSDGQPGMAAAVSLHRTGASLVMWRGPCPRTLRLHSSFHFPTPVCIAEEGKKRACCARSLYAPGRSSGRWSVEWRRRTCLPKADKRACRVRSQGNKRGIAAPCRFDYGSMAWPICRKKAERTFPVRCWFFPLILTMRYFHVVN